jgi:hypothetical protein
LYQFNGHNETIIDKKIVALSNPMKGLPSNAVFHPTIQTVGFQTAFSVKLAIGDELESGSKELKYRVRSVVFCPKY